LKSFLEKYSTEVFDMLEGEWGMDMALKIRGEEMWEGGETKGRFEVLDLMEQGYSAQQIRDMFARQQSMTTTVQG
jgi:hypothetical protein